MYKIIKGVIDRGGFDLSVLLKKIDTIWVQGGLTDAQREELIVATRNGADMQASVDVPAKLKELDRRLKALENFDTTEAPDFAVGKWYYNGDTCTFDGKTYTCVAPTDMVCVWSPLEYPTYWELAE